MILNWAEELGTSPDEETAKWLLLNSGHLVSLAGNSHRVSYTKNEWNTVQVCIGLLVFVVLK